MYFLNTSIGRLRLFGLLEGLSLLFLLLVAVPMKYFAKDASLVKMIGPIHGAIFLLFVLNTLRVGVEQAWDFKKTTLRVLIACFVPFGTFYIDYNILRHINHDENQ